MITARWRERDRRKEEGHDRSDMRSVREVATDQVGDRPTVDETRERRIKRVHRERVREVTRDQGQRRCLSSHFNLFHQESCPSDDRAEGQKRLFAHIAETGEHTMAGQRAGLAHLRAPTGRQRQSRPTARGVRVASRSRHCLSRGSWPRRPGHKTKRLHCPAGPSGARRRPGVQAASRQTWSARSPRAPERR